MPFGEETDAEQGKQNFKYNGKELDKEHGLNQYDYAARFMDPSMVRFTTVDPHAENYFSWSPYAYVGNNPMRLVDPDGKDWRDFLNGIIDGAKQRVDNIVYAVSNPEKTLENALKPAGSVDQVILNAADNASMGTVSTVINTGQAIYSDINGGDGSATGQLIGRTAVDAGVAVAAGKAGEVVGKGVSALSKGAQGMTQEVNTITKNATSTVSKSGNGIFTVTKEGVILPKGTNIPAGLVENVNRSGSYGTMQNGKFVEKLRIDPATAPGTKGPNVSHFHIDGGSKHIFDISKWPK